MARLKVPALARPLQSAPLVGRSNKLSVAPAGNWWFWAIQIFPAVPSRSWRAEGRVGTIAAALLAEPAMSAEGPRRSNVAATPPAREPVEVVASAGLL